MSENVQQLASDTDQLETQEESHMLDRIGHLTRDLHNNLAGLQLDKVLDEVATNMPDARGRLDYVSQKTQEAAEKVLNATDVAIPLQEEIQSEGKKLEQKLQALKEAAGVDENYQKGVEDALAFLNLTNQKSDQTKALLLEIMMAQDFQDLTGQVIKRVTSLAQSIETQLVQVLLDFAPEDIKSANETVGSPQTNKEENLLNGPQIDKAAENVVANQEQVDDLLDSLGF